MEETEEDITVHPEHILTFYRNEYQSAATITIVRHSNCKQTIHYKLKTTHKEAYLVSSTKGDIKDGENIKYIDILINENYPLQQCLLDRFKLVLLVKGRKPLEKNFKVAINYKKQTFRLKEKDLNGIEIASRTSRTLSTGAPTSVLGHSMPLNNKIMLKKSKFVNSLAKGEDTDQIKMKQQMDDLLTVIQQKRLRVEYLNQQIQKNKSRKKFGCYLSLFLIVISFILGITLRTALEIGLQQYNDQYL